VGYDSVSCARLICDTTKEREPKLPIWTLITVTYNNADELRDFWQNPPPSSVEWIVVDNNSEDESVATARSRGATSVIRLGRNCGFGFANNVALSIARGKYVAFVNPDITVDYDSLQRLSMAIDEHGGLVAPQLVNPDGSLQPNGRGFPTLQHKLGNRKYVCWAIGAALAGSRSTIQELGGWSQRFFIYYEDSEICLRAWRSGKRVEIDGSVRWIHGWARATTSFHLKPWMHEWASMLKFYSMYRDLFWFESVARRRYAEIYSHMGQVSSLPVTVNPGAASSLGRQRG